MHIRPLLQQPEWNLPRPPWPVANNQNNSSMLQNLTIITNLLVQAIINFDLQNSRIQSISQAP